MKNGLSGLPHAPGSRYEMRLISPPSSLEEILRMGFATVHLASWFHGAFHVTSWRGTGGNQLLPGTWQFGFCTYFLQLETCPLLGVWTNHFISPPFQSMFVICCNHHRPILAKAAHKIFWIVLSYKNKNIQKKQTVRKKKWVHSWKPSSNSIQKMKQDNHLFPLKTWLLRPTPTCILLPLASGFRRQRRCRRCWRCRGSGAPGGQLLFGNWSNTLTSIVLYCFWELYGYLNPNSCYYSDFRAITSQNSKETLRNDSLTSNNINSVLFLKRQSASRTKCEKEIVLEMGLSEKRVPQKSDSKAHSSNENRHQWI